MEKMDYSDIFIKKFFNFKADWPSIRNFINSCPNGPVLEIGSGPGRNLELFSEFNRQFVMLEPDESMLVKLENRLLNYNKNLDIKLINESIINTKLASKSIAGALFTFMSFSECWPTLFALSETNRILMNNGLLYIWLGNMKTFLIPNRGLEKLENNNTPTSIYMKTTKCSSGEKFEYETEFIQRDNKFENRYIIKQFIPDFEELKKLLELSGFEIIKAEGSYEMDDYAEDTPLMVITAKKIKDLDISIEEVQQPEEILYDKLAPTYNEMIQSIRYVLPTWVSAISKDWNGLNPRVLDVGCGTGIALEIIKNNNINPTLAFGIDISTKMLQIASTSQNYTQLLKWNLNKPLPNDKSKQFDLCLAFGVAEFIENLDVFISSLTHMLTIGGELWISFEENILDTNLIKIGDVTKFTRTEEELINIFKRNNLHIIRMDREIGYFSPSLKKDIPYLLFQLRRGF